MRWTPERNAAFTRDWEAGLDWWQMAEKYGLQRGSVYARAHRLGLVRRAPAED